MADRAKKLKFSFDDHDQPLDTLFPPKSLLGSMVSFGGVGGVKGSSNSFYQFLEPQENGDEPEKKKRLSVEQVQFLETCFKNENKLEPQRKVQLAHELGLQPRQIAVWFQNRKARSKTKHLETEYQTLQASYTSLKADYDYLINENHKLKNEVFHLKHDGIIEDSEMAKNSRVCDLREAVACNNVEEQSDVSSARLSDDSCRVFEPDEELLECAYNVFPQIEDAYRHPLSSSCGYEYDSFCSY